MPYDVNFAAPATRSVFDLKGPASGLSDWIGAPFANLSMPANSLAKTDGGHLLCHIGPQHWLILSDLAKEQQLAKMLRPTEAPPDSSIVQISDTLAFFDITGPDAAEVISIGCPLDLHPTAFAESGVTYTEFFTLKALLHRQKNGFSVAVEQSFAPMIQDYLTRVNS